MLPLSEYYSTLSPSVSLSLSLSSADSSTQRNERERNMSDESLMKREREKEKEKEKERLFEVICDDMLRRLSITLANAITTPSLSLSPDKSKLYLRYITSESAELFQLPVNELRIRIPSTGKYIEPASERERVLSDLKKERVKVDKIESRGHYGVNVLWSDGYYTDIFPYEILQNIAREKQKDTLNV